jgi:N-acetylglucosamine-6-phosphate deacetylase
VPSGGYCYCHTMNQTLWGRVLTDGQELSSSRIHIRDGRIAAIEASAAPEPGEVAIHEGWIAPGLIDLQVNGAGGVDLTSAADPEAALGHVARTLAAHGVTAFCPTIVSSPREVILDRLAAYSSRQCDGGEPVGVHVEGPFIDPDHRGVHDPSVLRNASREEIDEWLKVGPPKIVTLAPERAGALETIAKLAAAGVVVSLGHSGADAATAQKALQAGATMATHLFNRMPPLNHREPGLPGALLASNAVLGLIADGVHVHPLMIDLVIKRCGTERVAIVSDALASGGMPAGEYVLGDQRVISDGRQVRRADGTLAGSAMLLDGCLRNLRAWLPDMSPAKLVQMVSETPAKALGLARKGHIAVGCDADIVVLDQDFAITRTLVRGSCVID